MSKDERIEEDNRSIRPGSSPAAISGQSKTATNTISASNPCLPARRNWRRRARVLLTSANTSSARGWTFPWRFLINLDVHQGSPIPERIEAMKKLNQRLMEYLNDAGEDHFDSAVTGGRVSVAILTTVTDLPGVQRTSIRLACDREARFGVIGSCLACSALTVLAISTPSFRTVLLGRPSNART